MPLRKWKKVQALSRPNFAVDLRSRIGPISPTSSTRQALCLSGTQLLPFPADVTEHVGVDVQTDLADHIRKENPGANMKQLARTEAPYKSSGLSSSAFRR